MNSATLHNAQNTAKTSRRDQRSDGDLSEADFLEREVADAKAALSHAVADLRNGVKSSADLRLWVKHYPWAAMGAAAVAGFAAATAVTPAKGETVGEKLSRLAKSAKPGETTDSAGQVSTQTASQSPKTTLLNSLVDIAKVLIQTVVLATVQNQSQAANQSVAATDRHTTTAARS
jgi:hypothetical protein